MASIKYLRIIQFSLHLTCSTEVFLISCLLFMTEIHTTQWNNINASTIDDECTRHATLAACYQLAQSVLKIGFALAKKVG